MAAFGCPPRLDEGVASAGRGRGVIRGVRGGIRQLRRTTLLSMEFRQQRWQSRRRHPSRPTSPILAARPEPRAPIGYRSAALQPYAGLAGYRALIGQALPDTDRARVRSRVQDDPLAAHADVVIDAAEQSARPAGGPPRATLFDEVTRIVDGIQSRPRRTPPQRKAPHEGGGDDRRGGAQALGKPDPWASASRGFAPMRGQVLQDDAESLAQRRHPAEPATHVHHQPAGPRQRHRDHVTDGRPPQHLDDDPLRPPRRGGDDPYPVPGAARTKISGRCGRRQRTAPGDTAPYPNRSSDNEVLKNDLGTVPRGITDTIRKTPENVLR